jgi:hypothetical protein
MEMVSPVPAQAGKAQDGPAQEENRQEQPGAAAAHRQDAAGEMDALKARL